MNNTKRKMQNAEERYLHFTLMDEDYCLEVLKVREIIGKPEITPLPQTPEFIQGVINLRGNIVPIIDLRLKFELPFKEYTDRSTIVFVEVSPDEQKSLMGVVVDSIKEVVNIPKEKISNIPYINTRVKANYIKGIAETEMGIKIILDIDKVLTDDEFVMINKLNKDSK